MPSSSRLDPSSVRTVAAQISTSPATMIAAIALALAACGGDGASTPADASPDASCPPGCTAGERRCAGNSLETCGPGLDGCPVWGAPVACPAAMPVCAADACERGCVDDCAMGSTVCDGTTGVRACGNHDADVCLELGPATACTGVQVCAGTACVNPALLIVEADGAGDGTIRSSPAAIDCGPSPTGYGPFCSGYFVPGAPVTLTATPAVDSTLLGWSGGGCATGPCTTNPTFQTTVRAVFGGPWQWHGFLGQARTRRDDGTATWTGDQLVVWGGWNPTLGRATNDGERYHPATGVWSDMTSVGAPSRRYTHSAVWAGTELIIWGGRGPDGVVGDGARYDLTTRTWTALPATGAPARRTDHAAVWTGTEMIIWGGNGDTGFGVTTGARFDRAAGTWTALPDVGAPSLRERATVTWTGTDLIVWGGAFGITALGDGARWNRATNTWAPMPTTGAPAARSGHSATWTGTELVIWGGTGVAGDLADGARWNPMTNTWSPLAAAGAPSARHGHSATWTGDALVIWGGTTGPAGAPLRDGARYASATATWTALSTVGAPTGRSGHDAVWTGDSILIWDGAATSDPTATAVARLVAATWTWQSADPPPAARWAHTGVWTGTDLVVWGGFVGGPFSAVATGARFNKAAGAWTATPTAGAPTARGLHSAVWTGTEMIVWGGFTPGDVSTTSALATGARYNPTTGMWTALPTGGAPVARGGQSAVWTGTEMIVWGGFDDNFGALRDGGRFNPATNAWTPLAVATTAPSARGAHSAVWTGTEMVVWGGLVSIDTSQGQYGDGGRFNPATGTWSALPAAGGPTARGAHGAIWNGAEMMIWGGGTSGGDLRSGARWNPTTGMWRTVTAFDAPAPRRFPVAVWTGAEMAVWGGVQGTTNLATGGVLAPTM